MKREKGFMSSRTMERCISLLKQLGQRSVGLHHFGESLMHPNFLEIVETMNKEEIIPWLYTNGDFLYAGVIEKLGKLNLSSIVISGHISLEKRQELFHNCKNHGINAFWQTDLTNTLSLAGQVKKEETFLKDPATMCSYLVDEKACILYDGTLVCCCIDYEGIGAYGNVHDFCSLQLVPKVNALCATCPGHPGSIIYK